MNTIIAVGRIIEGEVHWRISPLVPEATQEEVAPDGSLQSTIDYAAELQELEDDMEDRLWHSRGGW